MQPYRLARRRLGKTSLRRGQLDDAPEALPITLFGQARRTAGVLGSKKHTGKESSRSSAGTKPCEFQAPLAVLRTRLEWAPILRQPVKTQFSLNGEKSHDDVSKAVHKRI